MASVLLCGIDRPGLIAHLALRGIAVGEVAGVAVAAALAPAFAACVSATRFACRSRLMVLAADEAAAITALDGGADDAVIAAASDGLIAARLARIIGRDRVVVGDLVLDTADRRVTLGGRALALLPREYALLLHLARSPDRVVTRSALREAVWGLDFDPGTNVIEVHVSRLRAKLGGAGPVLLTDKGRGYRLAERGPVAAGEIAL